MRHLWDQTVVMGGCTVRRMPGPSNARPIECHHRCPASIPGRMVASGGHDVSVAALFCSTKVGSDLTGE